MGDDLTNDIVGIGSFLSSGFHESSIKYLLKSLEASCSYVLDLHLIGTACSKTISKLLVK